MKENKVIGFKMRVKNYASGSYLPHPGFADSNIKYLTRQRDKRAAAYLEKVY